MARRSNAIKRAFNYIFSGNLAAVVIIAVGIAIAVFTPVGSFVEEKVGGIGDDEGGE